MKTLKYKGYVGSIDYSEDDGVLFGEILGIDGLVSYEGKTVEELTQSFHEAVEDYLVFCEEHNRKPQKSYSGSFNIRIAPDTHRDIANMAAEAGITINAFVKRALCEAVKHPSVTPGSLVQGYRADQTKPQMLREPEAPCYGAREELKLSIPAKDLAFAKDLAKRLGWDIQ